jgi:hypothetical protein
MALSEYLSDVEISIDNLQQIQDELNKLNDGGTYAFIALGENK